MVRRVCENYAGVLSKLNLASSSAGYRVLASSISRAMMLLALSKSAITPGDNSWLVCLSAGERYISRMSTSESYTTLISLPPRGELIPNCDYFQSIILLDKNHCGFQVLHSCHGSLPVFNIGQPSTQSEDGFHSLPGDIPVRHFTLGMERVSYLHPFSSPIKIA